MRRMRLLVAAAMVLAAMMALAGPASAKENGATFIAESCANDHTISPPADFVILPLQGTTVATPSPVGVEKTVCAPQPTGGKNQTGGGVVEPF